MKLHDYGWWYRSEKAPFSVLPPNYEYSKEPSFNSLDLLFDGDVIARKGWDGCWKVTWNPIRVRIGALTGGGSVYVGLGNSFPMEYIPKPEDFEVIREAS